MDFHISELKDFEPTGRYIAEFDELKLRDNSQSNIFLNDGDKIHIHHTLQMFLYLVRLEIRICTI